jgi:hypothetical protein
MSGSSHAGGDIVKVFFYGSFMNPQVLEEAGFVLQQHEAARLFDYDVRARPLMTLVRAKDQLVYGISAHATQASLNRLYFERWPYADRPADYEPRAVIVHSAADDLKSWPALCYITHNRVPAPPTDEHLRRVIEPARAYGFPDWYLARLEQLRTEA